MLTRHVWEWVVSDPCKAKGGFSHRIVPPWQTTAPCEPILWPQTPSKEALWHDTTSVLNPGRRCTLETLTVQVLIPTLSDPRLYSTGSFVPSSSTNYLRSPAESSSTLTVAYAPAATADLLNMLASGR
jgi:hypothetical protein